jgi:hypothetical protein
VVFVFVEHASPDTHDLARLCLAETQVAQG